jgi:hypothetical protein
MLGDGQTPPLEGLRPSSPHSLGHVRASTAAASLHSSIRVQCEFLGLLSTGFLGNFLFFGSPLGKGQREVFFGGNSGNMDISLKWRNQYVNGKKQNIRLIAAHINTVGIIGMFG